MNRSESIENIAKALVAFQGNVTNPKKTADNPFFQSKYAPLEEIINTIRPVLAKHGLSVIQLPSKTNGEIEVTTMILHESGEWIQSEPLKLKVEKDTPQGAGSAITYARRYSLSAMLGIESEGDDDANIASGNKRKKAQNNKQLARQQPKKSTANKPVNKPANNTANSKKGPQGLVSEKQVKYIHVLIDQAEITDGQYRAALKAYHKKSSKELTTDEGSQIIDWLLKEKKKSETQEA